MYFRELQIITLVLYVIVLLSLASGLSAVQSHRTPTAAEVLSSIDHDQLVVDTQKLSAVERSLASIDEGQKAQDRDLGLLSSKVAVLEDKLDSVTRVMWITLTGVITLLLTTAGQILVRGMRKLQREEEREEV